MARSVEAIIEQIRMCISNQTVSTMLIQTEDLEILCCAAEAKNAEKEISDERK